MPPSFRAEIKAEVKRAIDIVELIGTYVRLERRGSTYAGLCPFHEDHRPSLTVDPSFQNFKCWACGKGGDIFTFVMEAERLPFPEAMRLLAERAGVRLSGPAAGDNPKRELYHVLAWADGVFHRCLLKAPEAAPARNYLAERGISAASIEKFRLGFHPPGWEWLQDRARGTGFSTETLARAGLVKPRDRGGYYDFFVGRVLFPIRDISGRTVAFGGRILPGQASADAPKYLNSPESAVFSKGELLYGLDQARTAAAKAGAMVVVEGYTDCIMAHQQGVEHVVAPLGTAIGEKQVRLVKRFAGKIVLVFDGDRAGQQAAARAMEFYLAQQMDVRVATLPAGQDPCDFLLSHGADAFAALLEAAPDALEHQLQQALRQYDRNSPDGAQRAAEAVLGVMARAPRATSYSSQRAIRERAVLNRTAFLLGLDEELLVRRRAELAHAQTRSGDAPPPGTPARGTSGFDWQQEALEIILAAPDHAVTLVEQVADDQVRDARLRPLWQTCRQLVQRGEPPTYERLLLEIEDPAQQALLTELHHRARRKGSALARLQGLLNYLSRTKNWQERNHLRQGIRRAEGHEAEIELLRSVAEKKRREQRIGTGE